MMKIKIREFIVIYGLLKVISKVLIRKFSNEISHPNLIYFNFFYWGSENLNSSIKGYKCYVLPTELAPWQIYFKCYALSFANCQTLTRHKRTREHLYFLCKCDHKPEDDEFFMS